MALVGEDRRFIEAHNRAVAVVMQEVEKLVSARITEEGKTETVLTGNMVAALYNHDTSVTSIRSCIPTLWSLTPRLPVKNGGRWPVIRA